MTYNDPHFCGDCCGDRRFCGCRQIVREVDPEILLQQLKDYVESEERRRESTSRNSH